jgi:serine/threonine-protein kinase
MAATGCPDPADLDQLLEATLDPERDGELLAHLADCPVCRRRLEEPIACVDVDQWRNFWSQRVEALSSLDPGDSSSPLPRSLPGPFDGYEIIGLLGRGGTSVVYRAHQTRLNRPVALKMLLAGAHASPAAIARLTNESETIAQLRHPNIVTIHDIGEHQGVPYLCLELVEGGSLADRLSARPIAAQEAARLVAILARTVQDAHDHGLIHRDLKPANVLVDHPPGTPPGAWTRLLLTDFGLAKRLDGGPGGPSTRTGDVLGTPAYMAPEQVLSSRSRLGPAVDVYGLGAILYELLTGRPPFQADSPFETAMLVLSRSPAAPRSLNPDVRPRLEATCLRCLEKDPALRPASAGELAEILEFGPGQEVLPRTGTRHRRRLARAALIGAVLLLAVVVYRGPRSPVLPGKAAPIASFEGPLDGIVLPLDIPYEADGKVVVAGVLDSSRPTERVYTFDLCGLHGGLHEKHLVGKLTRNARIHPEPGIPIRYWRPIDPNDWAEVVYQFDLDRPVQSAFLRASLGLYALDSECELLVTTDPAEPWALVASSKSDRDFAHHFQISPWVCGARTIYVKARFKGRDDGAGSSLVQFLRSSTRDGDFPLHGRNVFELRVSAQPIPFVRVEARYGDETAWTPIDLDEIGMFHLRHRFEQARRQIVSVRARVEDSPPVSKSLRVFVVSPGCKATIDPARSTTRTGQMYAANVRVEEPPGGSWRAVADYGDGTAEEEFPPRSDGSFPMRHVYRRAGLFRNFVVLSDPQGRTTVAHADCSVTE